MKLVLAAVVSLALVPTEAHAECATPTWLGTASGTAIPERGSLYVYDSGVPVDAGLPATRISDTVTRLDYAISLAPTLEVQAGWATETYVIDRAWQPPTAPPRVIQFWHQVSAWTCSETDAWWFQVDQPTAAFRVRWTHAGKVTEYVEPAQTWDQGRAALELGKHDCIGTPTIPLEELAAGGALELFAIRFDGSEVRVTGVPAFLHTAMLRTSSRGIDEALGYAAPPPEVHAPRDTNAGSGHAFLVIAGAGVGLVFVGLLLAGRPRAPTPIRS